LVNLIQAKPVAPADDVNRSADFYVKFAYLIPLKSVGESMDLPKTIDGFRLHNPNFSNIKIGIKQVTKKTLAHGNGQKAIFA